MFSKWSSTVGFYSWPSHPSSFTNYSSRSSGSLSLFLNIYVKVFHAYNNIKMGWRNILATKQTSFWTKCFHHLSWLFCHPLEVLVQIPQSVIVCMCHFMYSCFFCLSYNCHIIYLDIECNVCVFFLHWHTKPMFDVELCCLMFHLNQERAFCVLYVLAVTIWMGSMTMYWMYYKK